jgi:hypothetical protein
MEYRRQAWWRVGDMAGSASGLIDKTAAVGTVQAILRRCGRRIACGFVYRPIARCEEHAAGDTDFLVV